MPSASPQLNEILTRWSTQGNELRKEIAFQIELIAPLALAANGNRLALRERYRRDVQHLEQKAQDAQARWDERLHRIEEWQSAAKAAQAQSEQLHDIVSSILWLENATTHLETFTQRMTRRADLLTQNQQFLHQKLEAWWEILQSRENQLQEMMQREIQTQEPLYVSRARKQPEIDFLNEQGAVSEMLGKEMQQLRSGMSLILSRLQKAFSALEHHTSTPQILYEVRKQEIEAGLRALEKLLQERRVEILSDALFYEACRSSLRRTQDIVKGLRCIEDLPRNSKTGWMKLFH